MGRTSRNIGIIAAATAGFLAMAPARAADTPAVSPFIRTISRLALYAEVAPLCGLRSARWSHDLLDAIVSVIERTRDGNAAHTPNARDITDAMRHVQAAHGLAVPVVATNTATTCQHAGLSDGLRDADGLVRRLREGSL